MTKQLEPISELALVTVTGGQHKPARREKRIPPAANDNNHMALAT